MINIHFIINPIAGEGKNKITKGFLLKHLEADSYHVTIKHSEYKKHAIELTQNSIAEKASIIVACGGDGTINEVASCLINSSIILGVIPTGSGNGLASNLNIPKDINKALELIKNQDVKSIDAGQINNKIFFSNTGIGFDAQVVKHYEASAQRKLSSYIKACLKALQSFKGKNKVVITINDQQIVTNPFLIFTSNSNELGYKVSLTPKASLQDGLLDVLVVPKMNLLKTLFFGVLILFKKHHVLSQVKTYMTKRLTLSIQYQDFFETQIDGEFYKINSNTIHISIIEKALLVIA
ncbi:diacylglycerol/lipid kinase family protein [Lacinutrix iliipiscaria]|uniref:Diacylglycerol/lipid kinase family protein n=1 Tax=Lacinutrix iliipiscaria TaxID=1230532 RepID=A0ABW5WM38_9FLAO